uniref:ATP-binding cassette sub-family B member 5 n=1 Tax=Erpetoichthys calabaricus TaxID=27687 RepID=A0A8C4SJI5_ERPCA
MIIGLVCSAAHGVALPIMIIVFGQMTDSFVGSGMQVNITVNFTLNASSSNCPQLTGVDIQAAMTRYAYYFIAIGFSVLALATIQVATFLLSSSRQTQRIREKFFYAVLHQHMGWFDAHELGTLNTRLTDDVNKIKEGIGDKICIFLQFFCTFIAGIIIGFVHGWKLTLVILSVSPLIGVSAAVWTKILATLTSKELTSYAKAGAVAEEVLVAIRTVVAFNGQQKASEKYEANLVEAKQLGVKKSITTNLSLGLSQFFIFCAYALAFWYGTKLAIEEPDNYSIGKVLIVFFSVLIGTFSLGQAAPNLESIANARGAAYEVYKTIDEPRPIDSSSKEGYKPDQIKGDIEFKNIHFSYPTRPDVKILQGLNLKVQSGTTIALVGSSGCGKSTTIQLLQRFYDPLGGEITLDGQNIRTLNVKWLRENIGIVSQEPVLFATTIAENIRYGREDATDAEIEQAIKEANAYDFISRLPDGLNTMVGERGAQLSGGQKQRIAIARAIVKNPKILLLDEATSALDNQSEFIVQTALDKSMKNEDEDNEYESDEMDETEDELEVLENEIAEIKSTRSLSRRSIRRRSTARGSRRSLKKKQKEGEEEENLPEASLSRILSLNKKEWPYLIVGLLASVIDGGVYPCFGIIFAKIIGVFGETDPVIRSQKTTMFSLLFVLLGAIFLVVMSLQGYTFGVSGETLTLKLRSLSFKAILRQEIGFFDDHKNSVGVLITRLATDASLVKGAGGSRLALACIPFLVGASLVRMKSVAGHASKDQNALEASGKISTETVENIRTVVSLTREEIFFNMYCKSLRGPYRAELYKSPLYGLTYAIGQSINFFVNAAVFRLGSWLIAHCQTQFENVYIVFSVIVFAAMHVGQTSSFAPDLAKAKVSAQRIFALLEKKPKIDIFSTEGQKLDHFDGNIEFQDVHFAYPTRKNVQVLQGLNVKVSKGQTLALVGSSGCGKSTSVQLLERFYDPINGHVLVDGNDITSLNLAWLRSQIGIVSQEPILFDTSIAENIRYGDNSRSVTQEEIEEAAKKANIHSFIEDLPEKYSTKVGDKGAQLSGGQKQRIAIARALVRNPKVLLLDEATSALDTESEKIVQEALDEARQGRTCIIIAHRLSTIQNADIIAVISNGEVVEQGTHSELIAKGGAYYALANAQSGH